MLETQRLLLRRWQPGDRLPFARLNADPEVMRYFPALLSPGESDALVEGIERHFQERGFGLWAVEERKTGLFTGFVGLSVVTFSAPFTPAVEVGWRLARMFWGRGYATEAAGCAIADGFERLALTEIVSFTARENWRSRAVMARLGMTHRAEDDFAHPRLPAGHPLCRHVLYRLQAKADSQRDAP